MAKKGNLLYNGDFETGTLEGWEHGLYGLPAELTFEVTTEDVKHGSYAGKLHTTNAYDESYIGYNKACSFEEYEAYLMILHAKMGLGAYMEGRMYALDDNLNYITSYRLGYITENYNWIRFICLLRQFDIASHFKIGLRVKAGSDGGKFYVDDVKLLPVKSIRSVILGEHINKSGLSSTTYHYTGLGCIGRFKLYSYLRVTSVSGTNPTLDTEISCLLYTSPSPRDRG